MGLLAALGRIFGSPVIILLLAGLLAWRYYMRDRPACEWFTADDVAVLKSKLPQEGSQAPTDWGSTVGANVKMTRASVKDLGECEAAKCECGRG